MHRQSVASRLLRRTIMLSLGLAFLALSGPARAGQAAAADKKAPLLVGSETESPPYAFLDANGHITGFSIDLIRAVTDAMGIRIRFTTGPWNGLWKRLVKGQIDILPLVGKMPERRGLVEFSLPHTETFDAFFVRRGTTPYKDLASARGKQIVVMRSDDAYHALLKHKFKGKIFLVDTIPEGLAMVASGKHDAFLCSKLVGIKAIRSHHIKGLVAGPPIPDYKRVFCFAVKKGDAALVEKLNEGLLIVKSNGVYNKLYQKWLSTDEPWIAYEPYLEQAIIVLLILVAASGLVMGLLQRLVRKRTRELGERNEALRRAGETLEARVRELDAATESVKSERQRLFDVLETLPVMISLLTPGHGIAFANRSLRDRFGEPEGRRCHKYRYELDAPCGFCETYRVLETGKPHHWELDAPDGSVVSIWDFPFTDSDASPMILEMHIDITDQRQAERSLRELNENLEQRIDARTRELQTTNEHLRQSRLAALNLMEDALDARSKVEKTNSELEFANRELESFIYSVSHDLRGPLRVIAGFSDILGKEHAHRLDDRGIDYLSRISRGAVKMSGLIDDLLRLSRISRQEVGRETVDLNRIASALIDELKESRTDRNISVDIEKGLTANADPQLMEMMLSNLLRNAWKFTEKRKTAYIEFRSMHRNGKTVYFVRDNGAGFNPEYRDKMFLPFHRLHTDDEFEGTGIGLAIVDRIIRRHGGQVWAEGAPGTGASIFFTLD